MSPETSAEMSVVVRVSWPAVQGPRVRHCTESFPGTIYNGVAGGPGAVRKKLERASARGGATA